MQVTTIYASNGIISDRTCLVLAAKIGYPKTKRNNNDPNKPYSIKNATKSLWHPTYEVPPPPKFHVFSNPTPNNVSKKEEEVKKTFNLSAHIPVRPVPVPVSF